MGRFKNSGDKTNFSSFQLLLNCPYLYIKKLEKNYKTQFRKRIN